MRNDKQRENEMTQASMKVAVIGAGTGGLALAHGLKRVGIDVAVYERDRTPRDARGGYRVGISPGGSFALKQCVPPELFDLFVATSSRNPRYFNMLTEQLAEVAWLDMGADDPVHSEKNVNRMILRQVLLRGLEEDVSFDKKFVRYEQNADGTVTVFFEDGTLVTADLLVGADGAGSRVRKQMLPGARQEETGMLSLGGRLAITPESRALLPDKAFHGMSLIMAPKGIGAILHVAEFEWNRTSVEQAQSKMFAEVAKQWPEIMDDKPADSIGWGLWAARKQFPVDPTTLKGTELIRLAEEMTRGWSANFRRLIQLSDPEAMLALSIRTSVPVAPWKSSHVTVLGDAIHTMTPGRGAGANTALRDAALLMKRLEEVHRGGKPLVEAVHEYEAEMLRYSSRAVIESRKQMDAKDTIHKPVLGRIQLAVMRGGMRVANALPMLKRRMTEKIKRDRAAEVVGV
jgi:2-polyprenyl-6-methoxyphenol hydroxylase-like FAD-dependent oxidoreductase